MKGPATDMRVGLAFDDFLSAPESSDSARRKDAESVWTATAGHGERLGDDMGRGK